MMTVCIIEKNGRTSEGVHVLLKLVNNATVIVLVSDVGLNKDETLMECWEESTLCICLCTCCAVSSRGKEKKVGMNS